jgi:hypothetical protein
MIGALLIGLVFGAVMRAGATFQCDCVLFATPLRLSPLPRALLLAVGLGMLLIHGGAALGLVTFHVKPFYPVGIALGALLFGAGVALLGYCPGTLPIALSGLRADALAGIAGGLVAGTLFTTRVAAAFARSAWHGPSFGAPRLSELLGLSGGAALGLATVLGLLLIGAAVALGRR